jgi:hypothetical protein
MSKLAKSCVPKSFAALVVAVVMMTSMTLMSHPAQAWDETGHMVLSHIAWEHMRPSTQRVAIALLSAAPTTPAYRPYCPKMRAVRRVPETGLDSSDAPLHAHESHSRGYTRLVPSATAPMVLC